MKDINNFITEMNSEEQIKNTIWSTDCKGIKDPDIYLKHTQGLLDEEKKNREEK